VAEMGATLEQIRQVVRFAVAKAGDNPYDSPASMRALDQVIRSQAVALVTRAARTWRARYSALLGQGAHLARDARIPPAQALATARAYKALADSLSGLASQISALPTPSQDNVWRKIRDERTLLDTLIALDYELVLVLNQIETLTEEARAAEVARLIEQTERVCRRRWDFLEQVP
jgi:hypothetical protein